MTTLFLEPDDEITIAVGRMRQAGERSVALVLPAGSRIASSRINFRLLAREAEALGQQLAIVSPESTARSIAAAAGLPAFSAVSRYEAAVVGGVVDGEPEEARAGAGTALDGSPTVVSGEPALPLAGPAAAGAPALPVVRRPRRAGRLGARGPALALAVAGVLVVGGGTAAGAYFLLPEARVTIVPRIETFGPSIVSVVGDPDASQVDVAAGVVPATWAETTVQAQDSFAATGTKVTETKATGSVTFSWYGTENDLSIAAGSVVKTKKGIAFATQDTIVVPKARLDPVTHVVTPGMASVDVEAVQAGTPGNVGADTITVTPSGYSKALLDVTNPEATSGGMRTEEKVVRRSDYDSAVTALTARLQASFEAWVTGGAGGPVAGPIVIEDSAALDDPAFDQTADELIGLVADTFDLSATADGRVLTVDPDALIAVGAARYRQATLPGGYTEVSTEVVPTRVASDDPTMPRFEVTASGRAYRDLDPQALERLILGRPLDEARAALDQYGEAEVMLAPDWFGVIPQLDWRVSVEIVTPPGSS